jgi:hypothetical protein
LVKLRKVILDSLGTMYDVLDYDDDEGTSARRQRIVNELIAKTSGNHRVHCEKVYNGELR